MRRSQLAGLNVSDSSICDNALAGDADLSSLNGFDTYDATFIDFDIVPEGDRV